jgi:hypothetical protein
MISAQPNKPQQEKLISKLMELPNNAVCFFRLSHACSTLIGDSATQWDSLMAQAAQNMDVLSSNDNIKILSNVLKTNVSACTSIGSFYLPQIGRIFLDMLGLYKAVSGIISETIVKEGLSFAALFLFRHEIFLRFDCNQDTENSTIKDGQERNFEAHGDVHQESRGSRSC